MSASDYKRGPATSGAVTVRLDRLDDLNPAQDYAFPTAEAAERFAARVQSAGRGARVLP